MNGGRIIETCSGKVRYASRKAAVTACHYVPRSRRRRARRELFFYHCPRCNGWHLTKQDPDER